MTTTKKVLLTIASGVLLLTACKKDKNEPEPNNPVQPNETELITTVKLILTDSANTSNVKSFMFRDVDGAGGNAPTNFDTISLSPNTTYLTQVLLLDESKNPVDTISNEVLAEANDHMFFYTPSTNANTSVTITDLDTNTPTPLPLGLQSKWKTTSATSALETMQIILKHQPGVKNGTITPGETDVDVIFKLKVQ